MDSSTFGHFPDAREQAALANPDSRLDRLMSVCHGAWKIIEGSVATFRWVVHLHRASYIVCIGYGPPGPLVVERQRACLLRPARAHIRAARPGRDGEGGSGWHSRAPATASTV